jgi:hypothetical protein
MSPARTLSACAILASALIAVAAAPDAAAPESPSAEFVQPAGAKSARRVGGAAVRCSEDPNLYVSVLAPAHRVGYTASEQPVVYWYLSKATRDPIEIAVTDLKNKANTVLEIELEKGVAKPGVQKLDLAAHKARLAPGAEYELVIEVVTSTDAAQVRPRRVLCEKGRVV